MSGNYIYLYIFIYIYIFIIYTLYTSNSVKNWGALPYELAKLDKLHKYIKGMKNISYSSYIRYLLYMYNTSLYKESSDVIVISLGPFKGNIL